MQSDGTAHACGAGGFVYWWAPGSAAAVRFAIAGIPEPHAIAVAGPLVLLDDPTRPEYLIMDTRSGALVRSSVLQYGFGGGGVLAAFRYIGAVKESPLGIVRLDTRVLPALHC